MIRALDSRLVAAAQWVVDLTQRQPHTLGGLSVALSAVVYCARAGSVALPSWVVGLALLSYALVGRAAPGFKACMRALEHLRPWSMLEVCLLGAMVAVFKLAGMLDVIPGTGLFALAALSLLLIRIAGRDVRDLWDTV